MWGVLSFPKRRPIPRHMNRSSFARGACLSLCLAFLAGCAAVPPPPPSGTAGEGEAGRLQTYAARAASLARLTDWEVEGRLALTTPQGGWQARLHWVRRGEAHRIDLAGPLGSARLRLTQDATGAVLRDAQHSYRDTNAERLLARALGWPVPFDGLDYWLRGLPAPAAPPPERRDLDEQGRLTHLRQYDWDIRFLEYARFGSYELPRKIFLARAYAGAEAAQERLEVRVVIERWELAPRP